MRDANHSDRPAAWWIVVAGSMIAAGGMLLGMQVDANGAIAGTGYAPLAIGALLALVAVLVRAGTSVRLPRDLVSSFAALSIFCGLAFLLGGVLAPGGPWMFFELFVLLFVVALRRPRPDAPAAWLGAGSAWLLGVMLLFRLWITYQGSEHRWQVASVDVPVLSWIPLDWLAPVQTVSLGSFTPREMGFPPAGVDFALTTGLWAIGFSLCVAGVLLVQSAAREHECDRVHDTIHTLPGPLANAVEQLVPEDEWAALGLLGLAERPLCKRIERLVTERVARQRALQGVFDSKALLALTNPGGFSGEIHRALLAEAAVVRGPHTAADDAPPPSDATHTTRGATR